MNGITYLNPVLPLAVIVFAWGSLALWRGRPKFGRWLVSAGAAVLFIWSWPPIGALIAGTLEWRYPRYSSPSKDAQAIVVLGAGFHDPEPPRPPTIPAGNTYLRCRCAAWLHQNGWRLPVVVTGGGAYGRVIAEIMKEALIKEGVAASDILSEAESSSTYENALFTARLLLPRGIRRIVLVTEAYHMPRAERCFRKAGFDVSPAPCGYTVLEGHLEDWLPDAATIKRNDAVLHEWLGLAWYTLRGRN